MRACVRAPDGHMHINNYSLPVRKEFARAVLGGLEHAFEVTAAPIPEPQICIQVKRHPELRSEGLRAALQGRQGLVEAGAYAPALIFRRAGRRARAQQTHKAHQHVPQQRTDHAHGSTCSKPVTSSLQQWGTSSSGVTATFIPRMGMDRDL